MTLGITQNSLAQVLPLYPHKKVQVLLEIDMKTKAVFAQVMTDRITLQTLTYSNPLYFQETFHNLLVQDELAGYKAFYQSPSVRKFYFDGKVLSDDKIKALLALWSTRALQGDPYTGYAIIDNASSEIIGNITLGHCEQKGVAQSGLLIRSDQWHKGFGKEASIAIGALAWVLQVNDFLLDGEPLEYVTATTLKNHPRHDFLKNLGLRWIEDREERDLYGIEVSKIPLLCMEHHPHFEIKFFIHKLE